MGTRVFHPYIISEIVSHLDDNDGSTLLPLMKVSKAFYHAAGRKLYADIYFEPRLQFSQLVGWTAPDSPWSKASLLTRTASLTVEDHDKTDCTKHFKVTLASGETTIRPLELPRVEWVSIRFGRQATCNGLNCPLVSNLRPDTLFLIKPQYAAADALPVDLASNVDRIAINLSSGGLKYLPRILSMPIPPQVDNMDIFFALDKNPVDRQADLESFRKACFIALDALRERSASSSPVTIDLKIGRPKGPGPWDLEDDGVDVRNAHVEEDWHFADFMAIFIAVGRGVPVGDREQLRGNIRLRQWLEWKAIAQERTYTMF